MRDRAALTSFADLLQLRAAEQPTATAFTWLGNAANLDVDVSYAELDSRARAVSRLLQREGAAGERALLVCVPGLDFIAGLFGCFYAGWVAVPAYPPPAGSGRAERIQAVARDAQPVVGLTSAALLQQLHTRLADDPHLGQLRWRAIDTAGADLDSHPSRTPATAGADPESHARRTDSPIRSGPDPDRWFPRSPAASAGDVAVLQYTSGSTAAPRGVMLTQANLLHNTAQIEQRFDVRHTPDSQGVIWLPPYHDMGLIGGILEGVFAGFPIALMAPVAFLQRPRRWLEAITRTRATISGGPNFAYDLCVDRISPADRAGLDLSSWNVAFNGSEPVRASTLRRFSDAFGPCGFRATAFYPCYGLAEATLLVAGGRASQPPVVMTLDDDRRIVGCGRSIDDQQLLIVDPTTHTRTAPGQEGEIWLTSPSVAAGYWNQPNLTEAVFNAHLGEPTDACHSQPQGGERSAHETAAAAGKRPWASNRGKVPSSNYAGTGTRARPHPPVTRERHEPGMLGNPETLLPEEPRGCSPAGHVISYLRTGDLGFVDAEGEVFITGRLKAVLIVGGRKIHAEDIEATLTDRRSGIGPGGVVALAIDAGPRERLVVVHETPKHLPPAEFESLTRSIRLKIAEAHQLPVEAVLLTRPGGIPKTSSGKVRRSTCREAVLDGTLATLYAWRLQPHDPGSEGPE